MPMLPELLVCHGISKAFSQPVLTHVDFTVNAGEIHALVGENGAGKSTLSRIIAGIIQPDAGRMTLRGASYRPRGVHDAEQLGVRIVHQELHLVGVLSVAENLMLGSLPNRFGVIDRQALHRRAAHALERLGSAGIAPDARTDTLGIGQQQLVAVAKGLMHRCAVLILDEPTAALTDTEIEVLFAQIGSLRSDGAGVVYISHRMEEIRQIADRVTVLRDGERAGVWPTGSVETDTIIRTMVGRELSDLPAPPDKHSGQVVLCVEGLCRGKAVRNVSFTLHQGEILGVAGLMGSGRTEMARALFGADPAEQGRVWLRGSGTATCIRSPHQAVRQGIALLTEDRKEQGLLLPLSVRINTTLATLGRVSRHGVISPRQEQRETEALARLLTLRYAHVDQPVATLSGGNQQKVILARWLLRNCDILIFDEPTRGIDIGARFDIYALLTRLASQGKALLVVSSDMKELLAICHSILVMSAGCVAAQYARDQFHPEAIMTAALSGYRQRDTDHAG